MSHREQSAADLSAEHGAGPQRPGETASEFLARAFAWFNEHRDAMLAGDDDAWAAVAAFWHPDLVICNIGQLADGEVYRGYEGHRRWYEQIFGPFESARFEPRKMREFGDSVAVLIAGRATGRASRTEVQGTIPTVYELRDGRIVRQQAYLSFEEALADAASGG